MTPYTLLAGVSTVVVGGGVATGLGFALKPSSNTNNQEAISPQDVIAPPKTLKSTNNYLVVSTKTKPTNPIPVTCQLDTTCQLFTWQSNEVITKEKLSQIRSDNPYLLNIDKELLTPNSVVEIDSSSSNQLWFVVKATTTQGEDKKIRLTTPANLMSREKVLAREKEIGDSTTPPEQKVVQAKRFHNSQVQTYVDRVTVNHESFMILPWTKSNKETHLLTDETDGARVDKYIFKTIEEQSSAKDNYGQLRINMNRAKFHDLFVEIYEISATNQSTIKTAVTALNVKAGSKPLIEEVDLTSIGTEKVMVTKLSQLVEGHYYKFVFSDFSKVKKAFDSKIDSFEIRQMYGDKVGQRLFLIDDLDTLNLDNYYCIKTTDFEPAKGQCKKFTSY